MVQTVESTTKSHPTRYEKHKQNPDSYKKHLLYNKEWKRKNVPRTTNKRHGIITTTKENEKKRNFKYRQSPKGIFRCIKSSCDIKNNGRLQITQQEFIDWYNLQEQKCYYCNITTENWIKSGDKLANNFKRLTIERINNDIGYIIPNIKLVCYRCNTIKSDFFNHEEMLEISKIIKRKRGLL